MTSPSYAPRPDSLAARVCAYFKANPSARLSAGEICERFGATTGNLAAQLGTAEDEDFLLTERIGQHNVYSGGPRLATWYPTRADAQRALEAEAATRPGTPGGAAPTFQKPRPRAVPTRLNFDPAELVVEDGIPMPRGYGPNGDAGRFDAFFAAMKVGQSVARPHAVAKALRDKAGRWSAKHTEGKVRFALRADPKNKDQSRLWRVE